MIGELSFSFKGKDYKLNPWSEEKIVNYTSSSTRGNIGGVNILIYEMKDNISYFVPYFYAFDLYEVYHEFFRDRRFNTMIEAQNHIDNFLLRLDKLQVIL